MLALSRDGTRLVVSNIPDATISVFNLRTDTAASTIAVARQPEGIAITPDGRYAWVGSNADSIVTVVDLTSRRAVDSLRGFGLPYRIAISPDGQRAVITDPAKAIVRIVDVPSRRELSTITFSRDSVLPTAEIPGSPSPEGVAISADSRWAFVTLQGRNRVAFVDLERRVVVGLARTGEWSDGVAHSSITP
jgi:YVTN family beta-propeller protein